MPIRVLPAMALLLLQLPAQEPVTIRSTSQEVLLDVVVRDKKGRPVRDLRPEEIQVTDDGVRQNIRSFRLATSSAELSGAAESIAGAGGPTAAPASGAAIRKPVNPLREIRPVTLLFERLGVEGRNLARQAALDFIKNETDPNVWYAVFTNDQRLNVLQQYTRDRELVRKAVERATTSGYSLYQNESDRIESELKIVATQDAVDSAPAVSGTGAPTQAQTSAMASAAMAQMTLNMLQFAAAAERTQQGRASVYGLLALVKEQYRLPGRKSVLYFTEGLLVPPVVADQFQAVISTANRANVSVYAIDARGLVSYGMNTAGGAMLSQSTRSIRRQQTMRSGPITPDMAKALDLAEESTRSNTQTSLAELAEDTGGFLVANSNDLRPALKRVAEDIGSYYELSYSPLIEKYDGRLRKIAVTVSRPGVQVQSRSGYFALPPVTGQVVLPFELPLLNALSSSPIPRDIQFRSAAVPHRTAAGGPAVSVVVDVPMDQMGFYADPVAGTYRAHLGVLALFKNPKGEVVQKLSIDVPSQGPAEKMNAVRAGHFIYTQHVELAPGRYTLETAVLDRESMKIGGKRASVLVEPAAGLGMSGLVLVRSVAQRGENSDPEDLFQFPGGKVTPGLDDNVERQPAGVPVYFTVYTDGSAAASPAGTLEWLRDGKPVARGELKLPAADPAGRISYIAEAPLEYMASGQYDLQVTVRQGTHAVQRTAHVVLQ
jgi:VWFA-related protein